MVPALGSLDITTIDEVIDAYEREDLASVAPARLDAEVEALDRCLTRLEAERLRRLAAWDQQGLWGGDGSKSAAAALARRCAMSVGTARDRLRVARRLTRAPLVAEAFRSGTLTLAKVRLLTSLIADDQTDTLKEAFALAERDLVKVAHRTSVRDLEYVLRAFAAHADPEGYEEKWRELYDSNRVDLAESFEGAGHLKGFLDPESTQIARHALGVIEDRLYRDEHGNKVAASDDGRRLTAAQRRAEAFLVLCQSVLDDDPARDANLTGVARPVITAIVDVDLWAAALAALDHHDGDNQTDDGDSQNDGDTADRPTRVDDRSASVAVLAGNHVPLPRSVVQRLLCDAVLVRVLTKGGAAPLEVGRGSRGPTAAILRALLLRDGGCAFPGCETPPRFCQAHHIHHWDAGGPTDLSNLVLLCRHHHRLLHHSTWRCHIDRSDRLPHFTDPDGEPVAVDPTPLDQVRSGRDLARRRRAA